MMKDGVMRSNVLFEVALVQDVNADQKQSLV